MRANISPNSCRICLKQSTKLISLLSVDEYEEPPREMLYQLTGIVENEEEPIEVPKQICRNCICELNLAYQFRQKALEAQSLIDIYCKELAKDAEVAQILNEVDISTEAIGIKPEENVTISQDIVPNTDNVIEILDESFVEDCEVPSSIENCAISREVIKCAEHTFSKPKPKILNKHHALAQSDSRMLSKRGRKPKEFQEEENTFICDICGNMFLKRSRLTEHRHRHETELKYACELCGERFLMREMLRRHMFRHIGEKPYKCSYCSRTFFYESVKKSHEAVHAGHKPYVCSQCNRAFAYSHALKKHELIHADIKLYHCDLCNKDFRLQHHVKQHEQTALHRNALLAAEKLHENKN